MNLKNSHLSIYQIQKRAREQRREKKNTNTHANAHTKLFCALIKPFFITLLVSLNLSPTAEMSEKRKEHNKLIYKRGQLQKGAIKQNNHDNEQQVIIGLVRTMQARLKTEPFFCFYTKEYTKNAMCKTLHKKVSNDMKQNRFCFFFLFLF